MLLPEVIVVFLLQWVANEPMRRIIKRDGGRFELDLQPWRLDRSRTAPSAYQNIDAVVVVFIERLKSVPSCAYESVNISATEKLFLLLRVHFKRANPCRHGHAETPFKSEDDDASGYCEVQRWSTVLRRQ
jgi:hypothetical protein